MTPISGGFRAVQAWLLAALLALAVSSPATAQNAPGGWVEKQASATRPRWSAAQIQSFMPATRGAFTFPAPYQTRAARLTDASDCSGQDCVYSLGYSYWRNTNNHVGSDEMLIFLSFDRQRGGAGATLFTYNKVTEAVTKVGPLFPAGSKFNGYGGGGWYFSATLPTKLYLTDGPKLLRYDVISKQFETVFDITAQFGANRTVWQTHSSNDDKVHSATLQVTDTGQYLGCFVYSEITGQYRYYPQQGVFDECQIDKSGRYLIVKDEMNGNDKMDNVYVDLQTGTQRTVYDAMGHSEMGYGYIIGGDPWNPLPNAAITNSFAPTFLTTGPVVFRNINWNTSAINHLSHLNAKPGVPMSSAFACGSNADRGPAQNEVLCFRLDTSQDQLVVAPVMTNLDAPGGGADYWKYPKGNLDISGQYFVWTSNLSGNRLDAFLVKVPSQLLVAPQDVTPPAAPTNLRLISR